MRGLNFKPADRLMVFLLCCAKQKRSCWTPAWGRMSRRFSLTAPQDFVKRQRPGWNIIPLDCLAYCVLFEIGALLSFLPEAASTVTGELHFLTMTNSPAGSGTLRSQRCSVVCLGHLLVILFYGSMFLGKITWTEICFMSLTFMMKLIFG